MKGRFGVFAGILRLDSFASAACQFVLLSYFRCNIAADWAFISKPCAEFWQFSLRLCNSPCSPFDVVYCAGTLHHFELTGSLKSCMHSSSSLVCCFIPCDV